MKLRKNASLKVVAEYAAHRALVLHHDYARAADLANSLNFPDYVEARRRADDKWKVRMEMVELARHLARLADVELPAVLK